MWAVIDRIDGQRFVLELEDGEIVELDKKHLPPGALASSVVRITMSLDRKLGEARGIRAKEADSS